MILLSFDIEEFDMPFEYGRDISIEILSTHANHGLLKQIASETNGKFYTLSKSDQLVKDLESRTGIKIKRYQIDRIDFLRDVARITIYFDVNSSNKKL